ncbi:MAG: twin-arginine translocase TatA/TatE family subunit [Actinomycetes bacterium]
MGNIGPMEIVLLGLLAVLVFGPSKLPEIGRSIGKGLREFKDTVSGLDGASEAFTGVQEIKQAASPTNLARAFVPGVADVQDTVAAAKDVAKPGATADGDAAKPTSPSGSASTAS